MAGREIMLLVVVALGVPFTEGFLPSSSGPSAVETSRQNSRWTVVSMAVKQKYDPKWKKQLALKEQMERDGKDGGSLADVGLTGTVPVVFKQGNVTKTTMAVPGQTISSAAQIADQYIKYGCKKGECGTCEALCNGKWIRPCVATVPGGLAPGEEFTIVVKESKTKSLSSGKFYSFRSFIMGFYNNALGMIGFAKTRKAANKNWDERMEYEVALALKMEEKKKARMEQEKALQNKK